MRSSCSHNMKHWRHPEGPLPRPMQLLPLSLPGNFPTLDSLIQSECWQSRSIVSPQWLVPRYNGVLLPTRLFCGFDIFLFPLVGAP